MAAAHSGISSSSEPLHPGSGTPLSAELAAGAEAIRMSTSISQVSKVFGFGFLSLDCISSSLFFHSSHFLIPESFLLL